MRAIYLTGSLIHLRGMLPSDKDTALAWFPGPYPVNSVRAKTFLEEEHKGWGRRVQHYAICLNEDDSVVGGVRIWSSTSHANVTFQVAPWRRDGGAIRADALRVLVPWLRDERDLINSAFELAADDEAASAAARELGLVPGARLREWLARPGGRTDLVIWQAPNPRWLQLEARDA